VEPPDSIGLIAGNRSLPLIFAQEARAAGIRRIVAVGFDGETLSELEPLVDELIWIKVGQLGKMIRVLAERGIEKTVMLGQLAPKHLYNVRPDIRGVKLLLSLKEKNAHTIFGAIGDELAKDGIDLIPATPWLGAHMPGPDTVVGPALTPEQSADVAFGFRTAKEISRLEIGQTVVVKEGTILAVEGFEGTDLCLKRGGDLSGKKRGAVAVKVARKDHDMRFDIPCIGAKTLETCLSAGISVIAVEANMTLFLDREEWPQLGRKNRLSVVACA
jgi:DUF1009 family protein